jgi:hypothetical protein
MHFKIKIQCNEHGSFEQHAGSHLQGSGCPACTKSYSKMENNWLDSFGIIIQKQKRLNMPDGTYVIADGYDPTTNTVYEFWGDFWHGNPSKYNLEDQNPVTKTTFGELYNRTIHKLNLYKKAGYNTKYIWESHWTNEQIKEYKNENQKDKN